MDVSEYLSRIAYADSVAATEQVLHNIHRQHVFKVPFENIDVHYKKRFGLSLDKVYDKVVKNLRGGFCYELNLLFASLLARLEFDVKIISARIVNDDGVPGPLYDHMCLLVSMDRQYLCDVGFGDLFVSPLKIEDGIQEDGRNQFQIVRQNCNEYLLRMSSEGFKFKDKYTFTLEETPVAYFDASCIEKQTSPSSYFVKNTVCTLPTAQGRMTIFNNYFIETIGGVRNSIVIESDEHLRAVLKTHFNIEIN